VAPVAAGLAGLPGSHATFFPKTAWTPSAGPPDSSNQSTEDARLRRDGQVRVPWESTPLDLFFAYDAFHDACRERRREVPFPGQPLTILNPEDLAVFKVLFDRDKDWRDLREILFAQGEAFDAAYATDWLVRILDAGDARLSRFRALLAKPGPAEPDRPPSARWALLDSNQVGRGKRRRVPASYAGGSGLATSWRQAVRLPTEDQGPGPPADRSACLLSDCKQDFAVQQGLAYVGEEVPRLSLVAHAPERLGLGASRRFDRLLPQRNQIASQRTEVVGPKSYGSVGSRFNG